MRWLTERRLAAPALTALILACLASRFAWPLATLPTHVSWNNNEGWNAYWSTRALAGQPLYTDAASPITNNYPPLSFYLVGWFGRMIGDLVLAGRLLSLAGLLAVAAIVHRIVTRIGAGEWGWFTAGLFLLTAALIAPRYLAADDPQWLAEAVMMAALPLLVRKSPTLPDTRRIVAACVLMLIAGLIKHNQLALPCAVTVWFAMYDRRALAVWLGTCLVAGSLALLGLYALFGPPFFDQVLHHQRVISAAHGMSGLKALLPFLPEIALAVWLAAQRVGDARTTLLLLFALFAVPLGVMQRMGSGVSSNAHFDAAIALTLVAGVALSVVARQASPRRVQLWIALLIAPSVVGILVSAPQDWARADAARSTAREWATTARFLARRAGPIICDRPALCYWSGKPYAVDVFNYGQKMMKGRDPAHLRDRIAARQIGAIVQIRDKGFQERGRLPKDVNQLIDRNYRVAFILPDKIYVLVPAAESAPSGLTNTPAI